METTIPRSLLNEYTDKLNRLSEATRSVAKARLASIMYSDISDLREKLIEALEPLLLAVSDDAAALAAEFYEDMRKAATNEERQAQPYSGHTVEATEGAIRSILDKIAKGGTIEDIEAQLLNRVDFEVKRAAGECIIDNASRDSRCGRWARVPTGTETCDFCIMLASRGFVYTSGKNAGSDGHYHANCDCRIVPGFDGMNIQGYDPDELYDYWKASDHYEYMKNRPEAPKKRNVNSKYAFSGEGGLPSFETFNDVKEYLYNSENQKDLEHRFSVLGNIYGFKSEQMQSQSLKNVVKTASRRIKQ